MLSGAASPGETALILGASEVSVTPPHNWPAKGASPRRSHNTRKANLFEDEDIDGVIDLSVENLRDGLRDQVYANGGEGVM